MGELAVDRGFQVGKLSPERLERVSEEALLAIPEAAVADLHAAGGSADPPVCSLCGGAPAERLLYGNFVYRFSCNACFENLRDFVPGGVVKYDVPIRWRQAILALVSGSAALAFLWGLIQQPAGGMDGRILLAAPLIGSVLLCVFAGAAAGGMNRALRLMIVTSALLSILAGNIWGLHTAIARQAPISWSDTVVVYFTVVLPARDGYAGWFLLGGVAGCWLGSRLLKGMNVVKFR